MTDALTITDSGAPSAYELMPVVRTDILVRRRKAIIEAQQAVMQPDVHYGIIPGTGNKPTLLKPGAEELCVLFGLSPRFELTACDEDWTGERHGGETFLGYTYSCRLYRADWLVAEGVGSCNSWEKKYRYRSADPVCPECHKAAIRRSKAEYGGGFYCNGKAGGCGKKFPADHPVLSHATGGQIANPDVSDLQNTLIKMACKRALIAAVLIGTGASAIFTQDVEDLVSSGVIHAESPAPAPTPPAARPAGPSPARQRADAAVAAFSKAATACGYDASTGAARKALVIDVLGLNPADKPGVEQMEAATRELEARMVNEARAAVGEEPQPEKPAEPAPAEDEDPFAEE